MESKSIFYQVVKQPKVQGQSPSQPELYVVEDAELSHFLHENLRPECVLIFSELPARNLYTLANNED